MRLHRFFLSSSIDKDRINTFSNPALVHQLRSVFRFHEGSKLVFFDGSGMDYVSEIVSLGKDDVTFRVSEARPVKPFSDLRLGLAFSLIKKDNVEWVIGKGTELGVARFMPVLSERSEKKGLNMERTRKIIVEAAEQSGRAEIPTLEDVQSLESALLSARGTVIAFHTEGETFVREAFPQEGNITVFIGPEGGWSPGEIELFVAKGTSVMKFSAPVLRAETAAIVAATTFLL